MRERAGMTPEAHATARTRATASKRPKRTLNIRRRGSPLTNHGRRVQRSSPRDATTTSKATAGTAIERAVVSDICSVLHRQHGTR
jgi:hypothetical protein